MGKRIRRLVGTVAVAALITSACSAPEREAAPSEAADQSADVGCAMGADRIVERLEGFLAELPEVDPETFLALDEIDGLDDFQTDIAQIISETTDQRSTLCNLDGLQDLVGERLPDVERDGVLPEFLIATIRNGRELSVADVAVTPDDDVEEIMSLLDDGSTMTFAAGTYVVERPLLVQRSITLIGDGVESTVLASTAADAVVVVVGRGSAHRS